ncbi:hypothetical protein AOLI_G00091440 [Acnodon oligacanthus]
MSSFESEYEFQTVPLSLLLVLEVSEPPSSAVWMEVSDWFGRTLLSFTSKQPQEGSGFRLNSLEISTNGT